MYFLLFNFWIHVNEPVPALLCSVYVAQSWRVYTVVCEWLYSDCSPDGCSYIFQWYFYCSERKGHSAPRDPRFIYGIPQFGNTPVFICENDPEWLAHSGRGCVSQRGFGTVFVCVVQRHGITLVSYSHNDHKQQASYTNPTMQWWQKTAMTVHRQDKRESVADTIIPM